MLVHQRAGDGQPKPPTRCGLAVSFVDPIAGLEDLLAFFPGDPRPPIADPEGKLLASLSNSQSDGSVARGILVGVGEQVDQDPLETVPVHTCQGEAGRKLQSDGLRLAIEQGAHELQDFPYHLPYVQRF